MISKPTYWLLAMLSFALGHQAFGQEADALIDRTEIRIGEQAVIRLSVPFEKANPPKVVFPAIGDTLSKQVEVVRKSGIDTLKTGEEVKESRFEQRVYITSFDTGYYAIPPFVFEIDGQEVRTEAFLLEVSTVEIDTTKGIVDIRDIYEVDLDWRTYLKAYWTYAAGGLVLLAVLVAAIILIVRWQKNKPVQGPVVAPPPRIPPHEAALSNLERLRVEKAYAGGKVKSFYTEVTDTLRTYLEEVFRIPAHELTSRQIVDRLRYSDLPEGQLPQLKTLMTLADMVKFAKEKPGEHVNEQSLMDAIAFVKAVHESRKPAAVDMDKKEDTPS